MKIRIAKKVFKDPDRYSGQQRYTAAHRMYRAAATFRDGELGLMALMLKPQRSFHEDDQLDLRMEYFLKRYNALEEIDFQPGEIVIPPEALQRPAFRRDGQVQNFNALKYPSSVHYESEVVTTKAGDAILLNRAVANVVDETRWEMGEWRIERKDSRKKYQVRESKVAGTRPPRLKRVNYQRLGAITVVTKS